MTQPSGTKTLRSHVARLRGEFVAMDPRGAGMVVSESDGYRVDLGVGELDAARFEALFAQARATRGRDPAAAVPLFEEAEAPCWLLPRHPLG